jgi:hypothetical protein
MPTHLVDTSNEDSKLMESLPIDILKFRDLARSVIGDSYHCMLKILVIYIRSY